MSLLDRELQKLTSLMPQTSSIMASAVAKLLLASPNPRADRSDPSSVFASFPHISGNEWSDTGVFGALLLVVDRASYSVLFQIYDLEGMLKRFEFEIYYDMEYLSLDPSFHAFEMEECVAGFSFSNRELARKFLAKVRALTPDSASKNSAVTTPIQKRGLFGVTTKGSSKQIEISGPVSVAHHQHVGLRDDGTMDLDTVSPEWRNLFKQAGVKKKDLKDPATARALIQSIQQSGYSLAVAPGTYVHASPLKPKEGPLAQRKDKTNNGGMVEQPVKVYTPQELKNDYTKEQLDKYVAYQKQLAEYEKAQKKYLEDLAEYEKQVKLQQWEKDNQSFLQEQEKIKRESKDPKFASPPPLPPRKNKTPGNSANNLPANSTPNFSTTTSQYDANRPRFETAPAKQTVKSYASSFVPSVSTKAAPAYSGYSYKPPPSPIGQNFGSSQQQFGGSQNSYYGGSQNGNFGAPSNNNFGAPQNNNYQKNPNQGYPMGGQNNGYGNPNTARPPANFGGGNGGSSFSPSNLGPSNFGAPPLPERPMSPEPPPAPLLPNLPNGFNPVQGLQEQLQNAKLKPSERPTSKMLLKAVAGSQLDLRDVVNNIKKTDAASTENLLGTLITALAVRRAQMTDNNDDSDDDWSD